MALKRTLSKTVAAMQAVIGGFSIIFAFPMYGDVFGAQAILGASAQSVELHLLGLHHLWFTVRDKLSYYLL